MLLFNARFATHHGSPLWRFFFFFASNRVANNVQALGSYNTERRLQRELIAFLAGQTSPVANSKVLREQFQALDLDGNGFITPAELRHVLEHEGPMSEGDELAWFVFLLLLPNFLTVVVSLVLTVKRRQRQEPSERASATAASASEEGPAIDCGRGCVW